MDKERFYKDLNINLDLALEAHDVVRGTRGGEIPGVSLSEESFDNCTVKVVKVLDSKGSGIIGKPIGDYITIESESLRINNKALHADLSKVLSEQLKTIYPFKTEDDSVLIVGLGNWNATPDALGPQVVEKTMATRHLHGRVPEELTNGLRPVSVIAPGVLGITGIETAEIIKGIVEKTSPKALIVIDALAAGSVSRIGSTIQISNTGINPGSGVGNKRASINQDFMGVPVIAIGVPTVVNSSIIAKDIIDNFVDELKERPPLKELSKELNPPMLRIILDKVLNPYTNSLMVTPKEVDDLIRNTSQVIALALTDSLHPAMPEEVANYLQ
ncbi:spore protease [Desulfonispora thiosulfatigenes DSM 11270]|uniref:Germination protease n=1 Tax=Desulfonispora thiosulfatigenes DSM 11270 TaxID=656914 RepID=A0A1W1VJP0_DESTI|nr:GPR endopeptidase [Desulfonispora thiosulfatigenes]SMB93548.1 spore protease [Desulfonispora thiosulfatigenes DSM 11270]